MNESNNMAPSVVYDGMEKSRGKTEARNPFGGNTAYDTVHNTVCGLEYVIRIESEGMTENAAFGQFLVLQAMAEALAVAKVQLDIQRGKPSM